MTSSAPPPASSTSTPFTVRIHEVVRGITDLQIVLPLFLEGPAFALFSEMDDKDKSDPTAVKEALKNAFALNAFQAYEQFISRKWNNEPVDICLSIGEASQG